MAETEVDYNPFEKKNETPVDYNPFANNGHAEWLKQHEEQMRAAGVGQPQRPGLQATEEPMALPKPLIERLTAGARLTALFKGLGEGATEGFGHETVGLKPDELKKLREWGILRDPDKPNALDPLRLLAEPSINSAATGVDAVLRLMRAGTFAIAGAAAEYIGNELGLSEDSVARGKRDLVIATDIVGLLAGSNVTPKMSRVRRGPMGETVDEVVSSVPKSRQDFADAAAAVTENAPNAATEAKVERLYNEKGVLPAEVYGDAERNPIVKQEMLSSTDDLPTRYGNDGEPPLPPEKTTPAAEPPEPPKAGSLEEAQQHILSKMSINEAPEADYNFHKFYRDAVDRLFFVELATAPKKLSTWEDAYKLMRMHGGWAGKADEMINHATFDFFGHNNNGISLAEVFKGIKASVGSLDEFRAFIGAARSAEMELRGFNSAYDWDKVHLVGAEGIKNKKMIAAFEKLVDFQNRISAYARDAGFMSDAVYNEMIKNNRFFIPLHEVLTEALHGGVGNSNPFKKLTGGDTKYVDPLETVIKNTYMMIEAADRNYAKMQLVDSLLGPEAKVAKSTELVVRDEKALTKYGHNGGPDATEFLEQKAGVKGADELKKQMDEWAQPRAADDEVVVFRNGRREVYKMDPEIASAVNRADKETSHWLLKMLAAPTKLQRTGIVLAPEFGVKFLLRDSIYAAMTTVHGILNPLDMMKAIGSMIVKDADFHNWMKSGAGDVSLVSFDRNRMQATLRQLTEDAGLMTRTWNLVVDPNASFLQKGKGILGLPIEALNRGVIHPLQVYTDLMLSTPHFAGFKKRMRQLERERTETNRQNLERPTTELLDPNFPKGELRLKEGVTMTDAMNAYEAAVRAPTENKKMLLEAGWTSRTTSADNRRHGAQTMALNSISLFAQAKIQDIDILARSLTNPKTAGKAAAVIGGGIMLPSAVLWAINHKDPRYQQLAQFDKDNNWHIITDRWEDVNPRFLQQLQAVRAPSDFRIMDGKWQVNNGHIFRIPKPFTPGVFFGSGFERVLEAYFNANPKAFDGFYKAIEDSVLGDATPSVAIPVIEQMQNRAFGGRTLIPAYLEKQLPEYQFFANTTELSKLIGKTLSAVPGINQYRLSSQDGTFKGGLAKAVTSPILIEHYIEGYTGPVGDYLFRALDKGLRTAGVIPDPIKPDLGLADIPVIRAFVSRYPNLSPDTVQQAYNDAKDAKEHFDTFMAKAQEGDAEAMQRVQEMGGPLMWSRIDQQMQTISAQGALIRQIYQATKAGLVTPSDARQHIDILYFQTIQMGAALRQQLDVLKSPTAQ